MNKFMMTVIFTIGPVAVGWVGWGFVLPESNCTKTIRKKLISFETTA